MIEYGLSDAKPSKRRCAVCVAINSTGILKRGVGLTNGKHDNSMEKQLTVNEDLTILEARQAGIVIPTLCYLEGLKPRLAPAVCVWWK